MADKFYTPLLRNTKIYFVWKNMKNRCNNPKVFGYYRYGGRGIKYTNKWSSFEEFAKDMYLTYKEGLTLERIDNNKGYSKDNCKWATWIEQAQNTKNIEKAIRYTFKGVSKTIKEWADEYRIKRTTLGMRLQNYNWPISRALNTGGNYYGR